MAEIQPCIMIAKIYFKKTIINIIIGENKKKLWFNDFQKKKELLWSFRKKHSLLSN